MDGCVHWCPLPSPSPLTLSLRPYFPHYSNCNVERRTTTAPCLALPYPRLPTCLSLPDDVAAPGDALRVHAVNDLPDLAPRQVLEEVVVQDGCLDQLLRPVDQRFEVRAPNDDFTIQPGSTRLGT